MLKAFGDHAEGECLHASDDLVPILAIRHDYEGYKDAAAVIAGSSLEAHLRQLAQKAGIRDFITRNPAAG
jgi:hypothetical protein